MMQHSLLLWIVLLVGGVFGDENVPVSVMEGDSVTLISNITKLQKNEGLNWYINNTLIIAKIDEDSQRSSVEVKEESLKSRLKLNGTTGSLTIANISRSDARDYKLQTTGKNKGNPKIYKVIVKGVPFVYKDDVTVKSVSVMEGDSVTLHTNVTPKDRVNWTYEYENLKPTDDQTGDLTITNIDKRQHGNYVLEINNSRMFLRRTYNVVFNGTVKKETVKVGKDVTLQTGLIEIQGYDLILWKTGGVPVAEFNKLTNRVLYYENDNDRLDLNRQSGDLIIRDSRTNDSGGYDLYLNCSTHSLKRTISLTVNNSGVSPGTAAGIVVGLLVFQWCLQL